VLVLAIAAITLSEGRRVISRKLEKIGLHATSAERAEMFQRLKFNCGEHMMLGDAAWALCAKKNGAMEKGWGVPFKTVLTVTGRSIETGTDVSVGLRFGHLVALAGDVYGPLIDDPKQAICYSPAAKAHQTAAYNWATIKHQMEEEIDNLPQILHIFDTEDAAMKSIKQDVKWATTPYLAADTYAAGDLGMPRQVAMSGFTKQYVKGKKFSKKNEIFLDPGRYLALAGMNFDHFGLHGCAKAAYAYSHAHAIHIAAQASALKGEENEGKKADMFREALAIEAMAQHYLSDLFAAGHIRTPRLTPYELCRDVTLGVKAAGLLAKRMHDEDNQVGLMVENGLGLVWRTYGDAHSEDVLNKVNRQITIYAMALSLMEVYFAAFKGFKVDPTETDMSKFPFRAFKLIPVVSVFNHPPFMATGQASSSTHKWTLFCRKTGYNEVPADYEACTCKRAAIRNYFKLSGVRKLIEGELDTEDEEAEELTAFEKLKVKFKPKSFLNLNSVDELDDIEEQPTVVSQALQMTAADTIDTVLDKFFTVAMADDFHVEWDPKGYVKQQLAQIAGPLQVAPIKKVVVPKIPGPPTATRTRQVKNPFKPMQGTTTTKPSSS